MMAEWWSGGVVEWWGNGAAHETVRMLWCWVCVLLVAVAGMC